MPHRLKPSDLKTLSAPKQGSKIYYDAPGGKRSPYTAGFGLRVTAAGARSFILNYRTRAGTERRYTIGSTDTWTLDKARERARNLKLDIDQGGDPVGDLKAARAADTIKELCADFIRDHVKMKLRPSTARTYESMIDAIVLPALGAVKVADVTHDDVAALHRKITRQGKPYVANRLLSVLSKMFAASSRRNDNPCKGIGRNDEVKRERFLSDEECVRFMQALSQVPDRPTKPKEMIMFALATGARSRSEVCSARWDQFDLVKGTWTKLAHTTKQKKIHTVPLSTQAWQLLLRLREEAPADQVLVFAGGKKGQGPVGFEYTFKKVCKAAGIKNFRVHDLRHTVASHLASSGFSLPLIGALLGHANPNTTARYAHLQVEPQRKAIEQITPILLPLPGT